jgi:uncharacterized protein (TIGR03032 family)
MSDLLPPATQPSQPETPESAADVPLSIRHSPNFTPFFAKLGISVFVSTYQAGKLIIVRSDQAVTNFHFRTFRQAMGVAAHQGKLAIGTHNAIYEFYNMAALAAKLEPKGLHDACYIPRKIHITGDIAIHEMAWLQDELWFVNTRFSCLCTLDESHSFVPRWRPKFISGLSADDRCHLNGFCAVNQTPKYATALGTSNASQGWREQKVNGGVVLDIEANDIVATGLSMPHSPRWHQEQLWFLESGYGTLSKLDPRSGQVQIVAECPGFTRGLDFYGPLAFIGLSQVRESNVFGGLPITERLPESDRICGLWVVNIDTGQTVAFAAFEGNVQEIFAVQVVAGHSYPDVIDDDEELLSSSFALPDEALKEVEAR